MPQVPLPCPNKCEVGSVPREGMEKHQGECQLEIINCSNDCGEKLERQCLSVHVKDDCQRRKVNCQHCHKRGEHQFIDGRHKKKCPKLPLPCPNNCEVGSVPREDMEAHKKECPLEMIQCDYYGVGCETRMARKDLEKHKKENMEDHLMKTNLVLGDTAHKLTSTTNQLAIALQRISMLEAFMFLTTDKEITTTTNSISVIKSSLGWPVKLTAMAMMFKSGEHACPVILKMPNYNELKKNNMTWCSNSFYSYDKGYKISMQVYPAGSGSGKDTHLSCSLFLMEGSHDDNLSWPLQAEFEMKLLNQISDSLHHAATIDFSGYRRVTQGYKAKTGLGKHLFISNENLNKTTTTCQMLKDNCLFFQITKV